MQAAAPPPSPPPQATTTRSAGPRWPTGRGRRTRPLLAGGDGDGGGVGCGGREDGARALDGGGIVRCLPSNADGGHGAAAAAPAAAAAVEQESVGGCARAAASAAGGASAAVDPLPRRCLYCCTTVLNRSKSLSSKVRKARDLIKFCWACRQ